MLLCFVLFSDLMNSTLPEVAQALIHDRDRVMWTSLESLAHQTPVSHAASAPGRRVVVGVVGFAHLDGIERLARAADGFDKLNAPASVNTKQIPAPAPPVIHL